LELPNQVFNVLQGLDQRLKKAGLEVTVMVTQPENARILGDEKRLMWALGHLIDNAIKYTEPHGEIIVKVGAVRDGKVLVKVEDTGVGISQKDLPYIFDRFYRGEARTRENKVIDPRGLGQGLFIAKAVTEAHGGTLSVASMPGQGTTFIMALPVATDQGEGEAA
jgi:signal transduction histidine kinase